MNRSQAARHVLVLTAALIAGGAGVSLLLGASPPPNNAVPYTGMLTLEFEVRDRTEALAWFRDVLGFEHLFTVDDLNWSEVRTSAAGVTIGFEEVRDHPVRTAALAIGVADIDRARAALEQRGARFVGPTVNYGPVRIARFSDPSGNMYEIFQGQ